MAPCTDAIRLKAYNNENLYSPQTAAARDMLFSNSCIACIIQIAASADVCCNFFCCIYTRVATATDLYTHI
jgi:hypothetical protein